MKPPISLLLAIALFSSCGPSRDANGHYWKAKQVWRRVTAGNGNPVLKHVQCPPRP